VYGRIVEKLRREAVEDFRIDFEDGYGFRPDDEEDAAADCSASETVAAMDAGTLPPIFGIRVKALTPSLKRRSVRTLQRYLDGIRSKKRALPPNFVVTLPKVTSVDQVRAFVEILEHLGDPHMEIMIEAREAIFQLKELVDAARGRCIAAHFGAY